MGSFLQWCCFQLFSVVTSPISLWDGLKLVMIGAPLIIQAVLRTRVKISKFIQRPCESLSLSCVAYETAWKQIPIFMWFLEVPEAMWQHGVLSHGLQTLWKLTGKAVLLHCFEASENWHLVSRVLPVGKCFCFYFFKIIKSLKIGH